MRDGPRLSVNATPCRRSQAQGRGDEVYVCHGCPDTGLEYLLETVEPAGSRAARPQEVAARLTGSPAVQASLVLCGHSHLPRSMLVAAARTGGTLCVNPGSVGLQAYDDDHVAFHIHQAGSPHARYALCERTQAGWLATGHA